MNESPRLIVDPLWRRVLIRVGLDIMAFSERLIHRDENGELDTSRDIDWLDRLRWRIEDWGGTIFSWGHDGSHEEAQMILDGEIPLTEIPPEKLERLLPHMDDDFIIADLAGALRRQLWRIERLDDHPALDRMTDQQLFEMHEQALRNYESELSGLLGLRPGGGQ